MNNTEEIKILIIEDETIWSEAITFNLNQLGYGIAGIANNFEDAVILLNNNTYDLIILDIYLNDKTRGLDIAGMINKLYKKPFIYLTASLDKITQQQAINSKPSAFLIKPINSTSLLVAIQSAINNFNNQTPPQTHLESPTDQMFFFVKQGDKYKKIEWKNVVYLKSDKKYTILFDSTDSLEYIIRNSLTRTLQYIIPPLLKNNFVQINRAEAIQISYIQELNAAEIITEYGSFAVTEGYYNDLKNYLNVIV